MAYIYMSSGAVLKVNESRNDVLASLHAAAGTIDLKIEFRAGNAPSMETVSINPLQAAVVSDRELP